MAKTYAEYKRHEPEETILYKILEDHSHTFFDLLGGDPDRKSLPDFVRREFDKFLKCGVLSEGFVRLKCDDCIHSIILAFSCKCRFCPSCAGRRMSERSIHLADNVIPFVPTRRWVLSVPFELRYRMASDDKLLKEVNKILCDEINSYLRKEARKLGIKGGEAGIVSYLQRAGSALNLNLHFHLLAIDGIYTVDGEGDPLFHRIPGIPGIHDHEAACVVDGVSGRVIKYLRKSGKLPIEGEEAALEALPSGGLDEEAEKSSRYIPWAEPLKRTFGFDLTVCPHCGGHVRIIAAIIRKDAIEEILGHLNLPTGPPMRAKPSRTEYVYESFA